MRTPYLSIEKMLGMVKEPHRSLCAKIFLENRKLFEAAPGSSHNHQTWKGGYLDHVQESMNIGIAFYALLNGIRPLPFSLSDALLILFLHDIEKPWRYAKKSEHGASLETKKEKRAFRNKKLREYGFKLTEKQQNAMKYVEGESDDYSSMRRVMNPLAAFCHLADVTSSRIWFDYPLSRNDSWKKSRD
ncbi:MAG: hypothetical protein HYS60_01180 [Candidatus Wildermuthbacteria bacterium]|nr:hypothetical protein [Candidatus Wildermuthbacteria bacterium]